MTPCFNLNGRCTLYFRYLYFRSGCDTVRYKQNQMMPTTLPNCELTEFGTMPRRLAAARSGLQEAGTWQLVVMRPHHGLPAKQRLIFL